MEIFGDIIRLLNHIVGPKINIFELCHGTFFTVYKVLRGHLSAEIIFHEYLKYAMNVNSRVNVGLFGLRKGFRV